MSGSLHFATSTVLSLIIYKYFVPEFFLWELHQIGGFINPLLLLESVGNLKWGAWPHDPNIYIRGWNYGILGFWSNLGALLVLQFLAVASIMIFLKLRKKELLAKLSKVINDNSKDNLGAFWVKIVVILWICSSLQGVLSFSAWEKSRDSTPNSPKLEDM